MFHSPIYISEANTVFSEEESYCISQPMILRSGAGFYIGTVAVHVSGCCHGLIEPYERLSYGYFDSKEVAANHLEVASLDELSSDWYEYKKV